MTSQRLFVGSEMGWMVKKIDCGDLKLQHMELCFHLNTFMFTRVI